LFRASLDDEGRMSGYSFDIDPIYDGGGYLVRQWQADRELWNPIARVSGDDPSSMYGTLLVRLVIEGEHLNALVNGVEVLAVELLSPSRFCVYVDSPSGVDHALCERVTRALERYRADWTIDVSSPGPERPLRKREHFAAVVGERVSVRTSDDVDGRNRFRGVVTDAGDAGVTLSLSDHETARIPYETIVRGNLIDERLTT